MTHPDSPEFLAILERAPMWHMLTPRVDVWREKDEILGARYTDTNGPAWITPVPSVYGTPIKSTLPCRRPIPEHVRRSEAWFQLLSDVCREHSGNPDYSTVLYVCLQQGATISGVFGPDLAEKLGTDDECEKFMEEGPGAYMRWIIEKNRP